MTPLARAADGAIDAVDGGRRWVWRQVVRTRTGRACARDRSQRVVALGLGHAAVALVLVALGPAYLLLLGPLVLGVPHVIADLRYLVVRGPSSLRPTTILAVAAPLAVIAGLRASAIGDAYPALGAELALGGAAIGLAIALAPGRWGARRLAALALLAILTIAASLAPRAAQLVLVHGHNLVAPLVWLAWTRRTVRPAHQAIVVGAIAAIAMLILAGALDAIGPRGDLGLGGALAPGQGELRAGRVVRAYAFLQAMHYVCWLRLIPSTQAQAPAAMTVRRTLAGMRRDLGGAGVLAVGAVALAVPVLATILPATAVRDGYLALAIWHVWLELAIVGYLFAARERLGEAA
ncbi:MAG: hypothetical protein K8W52_04010 [Deltaproteobacteria bacterium]|nr:hypothetical protein [Deltaproteobacteria bacterium]